MDISVLDNHNFSLNGKAYERKCYLVRKKNKKYSIRHLLTHEIIADDVSLPKKMSLEKLRLMIFRRECCCSGVEQDFNVFDLTFDLTFE